MKIFKPDRARSIESKDRLGEPRTHSNETNMASLIDAPPRNRRQRQTGSQDITHRYR
ncbi:hypothetical protein AB9K34_17670 [Sedimentitalea sp. XS_ASV28]|uniref:hypothetical protein n=1 Tax=Sedimentitalea sp. XS_ASV28 TaxID=3241296 RepID=UPI0035139F41